MIWQNWGEKQNYLCGENVPDISPACSHTREAISVLLAVLLQLKLQQFREAG